MSRYRASRIPPGLLQALRFAVQNAEIVQRPRQMRQVGLRVGLAHRATPSRLRCKRRPSPGRGFAGTVSTLTTLHSDAVETGADSKPGYSRHTVDDSQQERIRRERAAYRSSRT